MAHLVEIGKLTMDDLRELEGDLGGQSDSKTQKKSASLKRGGARGGKEP
jgi:hypothetical protein